jgi:hypothetical protein
VYRQVFEACTYQTQGLDLLASCECSIGDRTEDLPSRVLDMNAAKQTDSLLPFQLARGVSGTEVTFQGNVIRASGLTVGQVVTVYEPFALNNDQAFEILRKLYPQSETVKCRTASDLGTLMWTIRVGYVRKLED